MAKTDLEWIVSRVNSWREEAGIEKKLDGRELEKVLTKIGKTGDSEDRILFIILACEWLFRQKKIGKEEIDEALAKIETALRGSMHELAWVVTDALKPRVSRVLKEGRMLPAFGLHRREDLLTAKTQRGRSRPQLSAPTRQGQPPWPAPWIAGVIVAKRLGKDRTKNPELALDLVSALLETRIIEMQEFKKTRKRLEGPELEGFIDQLTRSFTRYYRDSPDGPQLSEKTFACIGTTNLFPTGPGTVIKLFDAYSGRRPTA